MVGGTGGMLGVAGFGAWGKTLASTLPNTPFAWKGQAGQFTDSETGNLYLHRRYYSPKIGRFLSRDPIGFAGGINLYAYCGGDPVNHIDPSGLEESGLQFEPQGEAPVQLSLPLEQAEGAAEVTAEATGETTLEYAYIAAPRALVPTIETFAPTLAVPGLGEVAAVALLVGGGCYALNAWLGDDPVVAAFHPTALDIAERKMQLCQQDQAIAHGQLALDLGPGEAFNRDYHYGRTPNEYQKKYALIYGGEMGFDHNPPLVQHYYWGDGQGGAPGFLMTREQRVAYATSISVGGPQPKSERYAQGGYMSAWGDMIRKMYGLPKFPKNKNYGKP